MLALLMVTDMKCLFIIHVKTQKLYLIEHNETLP